MRHQAGLFDREKRQKKMLATKDFLDRVSRFVAWEAFRPVLDATCVGRGVAAQGHQPWRTAAV